MYYDIKRKYYDTKQEVLYLLETKLIKSLSPFHSIGCFMKGAVHWSFHRVL